MSEFTAQLQAALAPSYTLERELTGGGMSRVFVATDVSLGRKVVVKVLPPELAAGVNHERFRREIQIAAQLQHPHIVPLLSAGEQASLIWYTMPYIHGESLRELLAKGQRISVREVLRIMHEVAEALDYAHGLGVIHRDIKPGNVLMQGNHALVTDFGVSKAISAAMPQSGFTSAGMAIGTPAYMAPEQIAADPAADHRMDLYALGLLAYELLTGKVPFKEASPQQTMAAQLTREPEPVEKSRDDVPVGLRSLLARLLQKNPADRPSTAAEVVDALDALSSGSGETVALSAMAAPSKGRLIAVAAAALLMVTAAWLLGERRGGEVVITQMRDSLAAAESLQALAPPAAMLTREDSIAIAQAVTDRISRRPVTTGAAASGPAALAAMADSIRRQIQRTVMDSMMRQVTIIAGSSQEATALAVEAERQAQTASRSAPLPPRGPRRVVVALPRPSRSRPELNAAALQIADSLERAFEDHPRYAVVPRDSGSAVLGRTRTVDAVREQLQVDVIVSISLLPVHADSVVRLVQIRDMNLPGGGTAQRVVSNKLLASAPASGLDALARDAFRALFDMERSARPRIPQTPPTPQTSRTPQP